MLFSSQNDVSKILNLWCMTGWRQIPARLVYAAMDVGLGYIVLRGYERLFDRNDPPAARTAPLVLPLAHLAF